MCWPRNWVQDSPILFKGDLFLFCHCHGKLKSDMVMLKSEVSLQCLQAHRRSAGTTALALLIASGVIACLPFGSSMDTSNQLL